MVTINYPDGRKETMTDEEYDASLKKGRDPNKRFHEIPVKGYYNRSFFDSSLGKKYQDVVYGYGKILFTGTWEEYDEYLDWLVENEGKIGIKLM